MAEKKNKNMSLMDVNEENFGEALKSVNTFGEDIVKLAAEKEEEQNKERKIREYNSIKDKAVYLNLSLVARAKYTKKTNDILADARNQSKSLLDRVTKGEFTATDYDDAMKEMIDNEMKEVEKAGKQLRKDLEDLRNAFPNHWSYAWDNPFQRLNRAIESNK
jgi:chemotaxis protein histidine kinase CheA